MRIFLKKNFEHDIEKLKIYFLNIRDRDLMNKTFNKLHKQN